ncbi:MAG: hypothetical protein IT539_13510 [Bradyrhizobiaceae bacterium]|nr:hypothetical protein [Bradyrhizobiaceae bacterium]
MSPTHPHGPHRGHPVHAHPAHQRRHPRVHRPAPPHHPHRRRSSWRGTLGAIGQALFRTRSGNLSKPKLITFGIVAVALAYVLLVRGFFPFDVASPWIESALERQLGPGHKVSIGYTKLEHDETGAPVLRVERIRVYGPGGKVIANAPSAEVGLDGTSLLVGSFRARRIDLVGAETTVHVGADGRVAITAGRDATPLTAEDASGGATPSVPPQAASPKASAGRTAVAESAREPFRYPELVRWLDSFEKGGLDGVALSQIGLKQGSLVVEDAETGRKWTFKDINIQLSRPAEGGLLFALSSSGAAAKWSLTATAAPMQDGIRAIDVVASNLAPEDIMLAAGMSGVDFIAENPLSGILRAQIAHDGRLVSANFRATAGAGIVGSAGDPEARFRVDEIQVQARFDPERRATVIEPFLIRAGPNRLALSAIVEAPKDGARNWPVTIPQGALYLSTGRPGEVPLVLDQVTARGNYDPAQQRLVIQQGNLAGSTTGGAFSGSLTFGAQPMLALGLAASQVPVSAAKRLWPALVAPGTRGWALERIEQGVIERILIALNVPLDAIGKTGVELPDSAVRLEFTAAGGAFRPKADLPLVRAAQVTGIVTGRTARVRMEKGVLETPQGRRIQIADGVLEVPDHVPQNPNGTIRFRFEGPADAAAEMVSTDLLRDAVGFTVDPASAKGTASANVNLNLVFRQEIRGDEVTYAADGELKDFSADNVVRGHRVEGVNAKVNVTATSVLAKGTGRVAGATANFDYRKSKERRDAEFRVAATVDEAARSRIGIDMTPWLAGPVQIQAQGRIDERENRVDVESDLTNATVSDLVPGWQKPAGRPSKAAFRLVERDGSLRLEDISVTGSGTTLKGSVELDSSGGFLTANLPVFHLSDGDKASLRAERAADGSLRVIVRGDVLDARSALRGLTEGPKTAAQAKERPRDLDVELRLGVATGHNGEVARQVDLRVQRRNGEIRSFSLLGKVGRDASLVGELRARDGGRPVLYVSTGDAGALFRFADFYSRLYGGEAWIAIDPPNADGTPQEGVINVREFTIRGEPALDRMQAAAPAEPNDARNAARPAAQGVPFLRMQVDFTRTPGRFNIREATIFGPAIGATVDGVLDFANDRVQLRGTYIPAYGINNLFGQLPIVGLFLGGPKEGLIAITFEVVGPASGPTLRVNPMSAAAPGLLRKLFEFRGASDMPPAGGPPNQ